MTACTLQGLLMISNCFHSKKKKISKSIVCKAAQGSLLLFPGWWRTGSSAGSQQPALGGTISAQSSSETASLPATHIDAILQTRRGKEIILRPAVFIKNNPHYQQQQKTPGEWRDNRTVRTECAQVLPEAAPDIKMPSCSLKKGATSPLQLFYGQKYLKTSSLEPGARILPSSSQFPATQIQHYQQPHLRRSHMMQKVKLAS